MNSMMADTHIGTNPPSVQLYIPNRTKMIHTIWTAKNSPHDPVPSPLDVRICLMNVSCFILLFIVR